MSHSAEIRLEFELDAARLPTRIRWSATDSAGPAKDCAILQLAMWDAGLQQLVAFDLWTRDTPLDQMYAFLSAQLQQLATLCERATANAALSKAMLDCARNCAQVAEQQGADPG